MKLRDYEWFGNPRGLHNRGPFRPFDSDRFLRPRMGWVKLVAGGDEYVSEAARLVANHCMPIVRIYRSSMGAMAVPDDWYDIYAQYMDAGVRWFELYNEPNVPEEWPQDPDGNPGVALNWENVERVISPLMDNWLDWAETMISMGAYPGFPALAASGERERSTVYWLNSCLHYLRSTHSERFLWVAENGLWCATHAQMLNHFYQEPPGGPSHVARPYYQQNAEEPGWHFEYPYDPILQRIDPDRTVIGGTPSAPYGDPKGLVAAGEAFQLLLNHHFSLDPVPVIATAGGITPIPHPDEAPLQPDGRYPPYSRESHAEAVLAMWRWMVEEGPPWFFGLTLSDEAEYYDKQGTIPAIERMIETPPILKDVAALEASRDQPQSLAGGATEPDITSAPAGAEAPRPSEGTAVVIGEIVTPEKEPEDWAGEFVPAPADRAQAPPEGPEDLPENMKERLAQATGAAQPEAFSQPVEEPGKAPCEEAEEGLPPSAGLPPERPVRRARVLPGLASVEPEHHWLVFGPGADPAWFFDAGFRYWQAFHPTISPSWEHITLVPEDESLLVTILAPTDRLDVLAGQILKLRPEARIDPVACEVRNELAAELNWRVVTGRREG